jgi:hypothetical protein
MGHDRRYNAYKRRITLSSNFPFVLYGKRCWSYIVQLTVTPEYLRGFNYSQVLAVNFETVHSTLNYAVR